MASTFTFPGVYTQIIDKSFFTPMTSRFKPGLIGVAQKGPFNTPVKIASLNDFVKTFGNPIVTSYTTDQDTGLQKPVNGGYFLADAVDAVSSNTNAITVVRIGNQYTELAPADGISGGAYLLKSAANAQRIYALQSAGKPVYLRVQQSGLVSTVNALVSTAGGGTIALDPSTGPLADAYGSATISYGAEDAANTAEGFLYCYTYGSVAGSLTDSPLTSVGAVSGLKNQYTFSSPTVLR